MTFKKQQVDNQPITRFRLNETFFDSKTRRVMIKHLLHSTLAQLFLIVISLTAITSYAEPHRMNAQDLAVPTDDSQSVSQGQSIFSEKCSACHGGSGVGTGRAPCVSCGKYVFRGNTNSEVYETIANGTPRNGSRGGKMGAFSSILSHEEILSVVAYLRHTEKIRIVSGEIPDPYAASDDVLVFPE